MKKTRHLTAIILCLTLTFILSSCGRKSNDESLDNVQSDTTEDINDSTAETDIETESLTANEESTGDASENPSDTEETESNPVTLIHPVIYNSQFDDTYEAFSGFLYTYAVSSSPLLEGEEASTYPKLNESLGAQFQNDITESRNILNQIYSDGKATLDLSSATDLNYYLYSSYDGSILRADSVVLSVVRHYEYDGGGTHGDYGDYAECFDTVTGKKLTIYDIVSDTSSLSEALKEKLYEYYSDLGLRKEDIDTCLETFFEEQQEEREYLALTFGVGYEGVNFYFSTYSIGPYSNGTQQITLSYAEYPQLFEAKYTAKPDNYISNISHLDRVFVDLDGDGGTNEISVEYLSSESSYDNSVYDTLNISVDGQKESFSTYFYRAETYLVKYNGNFYIYVFNHEDNDVVTCEVYHLNKDAISKTDYAGNVSPSVVILYDRDQAEESAEDSALGSNTEGNAGESDTLSYSEESDISAYSVGGETSGFNIEAGYIEKKIALVDPLKMTLQSNLDVLGTYSASRSYLVGENGIPQSNELFILDSRRTLTAVKDFDGRSTDENGNPKNKLIHINKGEELSIYATDGESFVILSTKAGEYIKLNYDKSSWPYTVDGVPEDEIFSGMAYAG